MGYFLDGDQLKHFLHAVDADRDADGRWVLSGLVVSFMGGEQDYVVSDDARYYVRGEPRGLANGLAGTGYGTKVQVIDCTTAEATPLAKHQAADVRRLPGPSLRADTAGASEGD